MARFARNSIPPRAFFTPSFPGRYEFVTRILAIQHTLLIATSFIFTLILFKSAGIGDSDAASFLTMTILVVGIRPPIPAHQKSGSHVPHARKCTHPAVTIRLGRVGYNPGRRCGYRSSRICPRHGNSFFLFLRTCLLLSWTPASFSSGSCLQRPSSSL